MHQIEYTNDLYTFDIETTTFESGENKYTDVYLANFLKIPFDMELTKEQIEKYNVVFVRSWSDINSYFEKISEQVPEGKHQLIYIHNLAYEWDGIIKNCSFFREAWLDGSVDSLFIKSRKPLFVRCKNIELRCSFKLINKSLRALGNIYGYPKLDIDYTNQWFSFSNLPAEEYIYNERDVKCTAYSILQECKNYPYIQNTNDIPLTNTSLTRQMNKLINSRKDNHSYKTRNQTALKHYKDNIELYEKIYQGAYSHSNAYHTGKVLKNISSIDITSSYPDVMLHKKFPYNFKQCTTDCNSWFKYVWSKNNITLDQVLDNISNPFIYAFFGCFRFRNVRCKTFLNNVNIPSLSWHKILNKPICTIDNGRIVNANEILIYYNHIDYWLFTQFYDFELVEVSDFWYTRSFRDLHQFVKNNIRTYANEKTIFKQCSKVVQKRGLKKEDFYCEKINDYICSDEVIKTITRMPRAEQEQNINIMLMTSKNRLNAQYGINVQRLYQDEYIYNIEEDDFTHQVDKSLPRSLYRNFEEGMYITAYARLTLFTMALYLIRNDLRPIYSDTDSWKIIGRPEEVKRVVAEYNQVIEKSAHNSEDYEIGYFDFESTYDYFITLGSKKYLAIDSNGVVHPTIAGVPKNTIGEVYTNLLQEYYNNDVEAFVEDCFKPCTVLSYSAIEKLSTRYSTDSFEGMVTDENGEQGKISFNNMVELVPTDYAILDINNKVNADYIKYLEFVQNRKFNTDWSIISKEDNQIKIDYITNYKQKFYLKNDYMEKLEEYINDRTGG